MSGMRDMGGGGAGGSGTRTRDWKPTRLDDLDLWLDERARHTFFQDDAGSTRATASDPVGLWRDRSPQGNDATQSTSSKRPTLEDDRVNPDGSDDLMQVDGLNTASSDDGYTLLSDMRGLTSASDEQTLFRARDTVGFGSASGISFTFKASGAWNQGASPVEDGDGDAYTLDTGSLALDGDDQLLTVAYGADSALGRMGGSDQTTTITVRNGSLPLGTISLNNSAIMATLSSGGDESRHWEGSVSEMMIYSRRITDAEIAAAEHYLATKRNR